MTAQVKEQLIFKGKTFQTPTEPLGPYLASRSDVKFFSTKSTCLRGYVGTWTIQNNQLYLTKLVGTVLPNKKVGYSYLFPNSYNVFADWFSGKIIAKSGVVLNGYPSFDHNAVFEKNLIFVFEKGVLIDLVKVDNFFNAIAGKSDIDIPWHIKLLRFYKFIYYATRRLF